MSVWRLGSVELKGFDNIATSTVTGVMENQPPKLLNLGEGPVFDPLSVERDKKRLIQLYQEYGFFNAQIILTEKRNEKDHTVNLVFDAHENQPALINDVEITFEAPLDEERWRSSLLERSVLKRGKRFLLDDYRKTKEQMGDYMSDQAHPLHTLEGQVRVMPDRLKVDIVFFVKPGPRVFFGKSEVKGATHINEAIILRELTFLEGEPFSLASLRTSQKNLLDTGFFNSVSLKPQYRRMQGQRAPVVVEVHERKEHSVRFGMGWGTEEGFRFRLVQDNRDPFGLGDTLSFEGKYSNIYEGLVGLWKLPKVFNEHHFFALRGGLEQEDNEAYIHRRLFVHPQMEFRRDDKLSFFLGYNQEKDRMVEIKSLVPDADYENQSFFIVSVPIGMKFDARDSILNPTRGFFFRVDMETAFKALGSDLGFVRPVSEFRYVYPLDWPKGWRLAARVKAGAVLSLLDDNRIPLIRRFFPGGADSVRGYPYQSLGPLDPAGKPLGGEAELVSNWEVRFPLWKELGGVLFVDAGNAWENIDTGIGGLRFTTGFGLRYETPVGPLRVDYGYQLNPPGDAPIPRYQFYLSVGQAF